MSLDVYLKAPSSTYDCDDLYWANITHNLTEMADQAGIYKALWRPEEIGIKLAKELIPILEAGLKDLRSRPTHFSKFNASNGWGKYEHFVPFVQKYLEACIEYPESNVHVSR